MERGTVQGICARGGIVIEMEWSNRHLKKIAISAEKRGATKIGERGESGGDILGGWGKEGGCLVTMITKQVLSKSDGLVLTRP